MITNAFHHRPDLIGVNIEKVDNQFSICIAFKDGDKWKAKTLSGLSGDFDNLKLIDSVISSGQGLDVKTASSMFTQATKLNLEYSNK